MASKEQIFRALAPYQVPVDRKILEKQVGESYRRFQTQLERWAKQGLLEEKKRHHYILTSTGREELESFVHPGLEEEIQAGEMEGNKKQSAYFLLPITQDDLNRLSEAEFKTVWNNLGKIIRSRGYQPKEDKTV